MRVMWKGVISFGLVTIPVKVFGATQIRSVAFHLLHDEDHGRIRFRRTCSVCDQEVGLENIVRGHEIEKERYVIVRDEELEALPVASNHTVDILQFVRGDDIDPIYFQRSYYLVPEKVGVKAYQLLRRAMAQEDRVAVAKVAFREKEHLATVRLRGDVLVLETMYWPDEIRPAEFEEIAEDVPVRPQEVEMARSLIDTLTEPWAPEAFQDDYRRALLDLIEKKAAGEVVEEAAPPSRPAEVIDLVAAHRARVDHAQKPRRPAGAGS